MSAPAVPWRWLRACWPGPLLQLWAARRRARGGYDRLTLAAYRAACPRVDQAGAGRASALSLCRWLAFRRDLGRPLPRRCQAPLVAALPQLPPVWRRRALAWLAESAPAHLAGLPAAWLDDAADLPGVAAALGRPACPGLRGAPELARWLTGQAGGGRVCVVGNAAALAGAGLGAAIDAQALVCRFNRWWGGAARPADVGQRLDLWVVAPDYDGELPSPLPAWALVSGPDPRYQVRHWPVAQRLAAAGIPVATLPLPVWRALVRELQAPPSAGLLLLAWLRQVLPPGGLAVAGVGLAAQPGPYHLAQTAARPGRRHHWRAEAGLLARWRQEGLAELGPQPPGAG